jgi:hypothetical protein
MAKGTWSMAEKDDPIFTGRFTVSSEKSPKELKTSKKTSQDDAAKQSTVNSTQPKKETDGGNAD